jgi:hypothetical protein
MIIGNRRRGAFVVALAISLVLLFTFGILFWFRQHRTITPKPPMPAQLVL